MPVKDYKRPSDLTSAALGRAHQDTGLVFTREDGAELHPDANTKGVSTASRQPRPTEDAPS